MTLRHHRRPILIIMVLMMVWMSLWSSTCLAMGTGQSSMPGMTCDCPYAGQTGDMAAGCAKADNLSTYADAKPVPLNTPVFHAVAPTPVELTPPVSQLTVALSTLDRPPPSTHRRLNIEHCVFLI